MNNIAVLTHDPKGKWGDVRPQIEQGSYENWGKGGISLELGQKVLIYISKGLNQIKYIMEVSNVYDDSVDLKLVKILDEIESKQLSFAKLKENGLKVGTVNYILDNNKSLFNYVVSVLNGNIKDANKKNQMKIKNIMLYGAPGVGKTYNYKKLISMIESGDDEKTIFDIISKNEDTKDFNYSSFDEAKNDKRIEFVTFHQSYSYEDFIEGFRPNENGKIELEEYGIFKKICKDAEENLANSKINIKEDNLNINELIIKFTNHIQDSLDNNKEFNLDKKVTIEGINDKNAFLLGGSIKSPQRLTPDIIKRDYNEFKNGNISKFEEVKPTRESKSVFHGNARYYFMLYKKIFEFEKTIKFDSIQKKKEEQKNFYIIIDEINRGNISKIFGELITLIEEDKRGKEEYRVTLPYSKKTFLIPENLYIIATMNSTDKSIATIDIALRRRFTFLKMQPNPELVKNIDAKQLMEELNQYIKKTIGEDYQLGHSYFMNLKDKEDLDFVVEYKIKPLLEEYFYSDDKTPDEIIDLAKKEYNKE